MIPALIGFVLGVAVAKAVYERRNYDDFCRWGEQAKRREKEAYERGLRESGGGDIFATKRAAKRCYEDVRRVTITRRRTEMGMVSVILVRHDFATDIGCHPEDFVEELLRVIRAQGDEAHGGYHRDWFKYVTTARTSSDFLVRVHGNTAEVEAKP